MRLVHNPCEGCKERHIGCHSTCERYLQSKAETEVAKEKERLSKVHDGYLADIARRRRR